MVDSHDISILPAYAYGIFGRELTTVEFNNLQKAFLDGFRH